jgi:hypothetical protein
MNLTRRQAIAKAKKIIETIPLIIPLLDPGQLDESGKWLDDCWIGLSDNWDLNLWTGDVTQSKFASLYPVIDGQTNTMHETDLEVKQWKSG